MTISDKQNELEDIVEVNTLVDGVIKERAGTFSDDIPSSSTLDAEEQAHANNNNNSVDKKTVSQKKVKSIDNVLPTNDLLDGYRFFDMSI